MSGETELRERAALLDELRQIVQSMKNLAFAELQRVTRMRQPQALAQDAVTSALSQLPPPQEPSQPGPISWLLIGAERGFCGAYNAQLANAAPQTPLLIASSRLLTLLESHDTPRVALPGCATSEEADTVLNAWLDALRPLIDQGHEVWLMHMGSQGLVQRRLWPLEAPRPETAGAAGHGSARPNTQPAKTYLPTPKLIEALSHQALRLTLQAALLHSLEQENHWRLNQMQRAQDHLDKLGVALKRRYATLRQANITNELETLASSTIR